MNLAATLRLACRSLLRNKVRTFLTMLGIVIGIASVIAMVALGEGASRMIQAQIASLGRNVLMVIPGAASSGGSSWGAGTLQTLTPEDAAAIVKELHTVTAATPLVRIRTQIVHGNRNWVPNYILGTGAAYPEVRSWTVDEGAFFSEAEAATAAKVCVVGATVVEQLFQGESPLQRVIRIKNVPLKVVGTFARKGSSATGHDQDDLVVVPWTTATRSLQGTSFNNIDQILVSAASAEAMEEATREITALLRQRHRLREGNESDFRVQAMTEWTNASRDMAETMTFLLLNIASISLLVGGIGIMNIMLVSVAERTREIGLRMAVGARGRDILGQFLLEAVALSSVAGVFGMALGAGAAVTISRTLAWPTHVSPAAAGLAFLFSAAVGVFFGLYPAIRASRLDPIEALRYE